MNDTWVMIIVIAILVCGGFMVHSAYKAGYYKAKFEEEIKK